MKQHFRKIKKFGKRHCKQIVLVGGGIAGLVLVFVVASYVIIGRYGQYVLRTDRQVTQAFGQEKPVGIVLGGGVSADGRPLPLLQDRLDTTAELLKAGLIRKVIVSGDNRFKNYDEPTVMRDYLIKEKAVDPGLIQPDFAGRSTYETCERAKKIFELNTTLLISESTHLPRAVYLCRSFGVRAYGYQSDGQSSAGLKLGQRWREVLARTKATFNVYIFGEKTVLGEKIWQDETVTNPFMPPATPPPYVQQQMAGMSLRDKVASLFIVHVPGTSAPDLASYMTVHKVSGLIFMGDNMPRTPGALQALTGALSVGKQLAPLIAIDQEGDVVKRLQTDTYAGAKALRGLPPDETRSAFAARGELLKAAGFNLNFGIVADVTANKNSFIYDRVLGTTPQDASERVRQAVLGSRTKTLATIKHFPGHGETIGDSHSSVPSSMTTYDQWQKGAAMPFKAGIAAQADMVMFGHLRYTAVDNTPATLSKKWHDILRGDLGFRGLSITDDMIMLQNAGDPAYKDPVKNAVAALAAGNDILLYVLNHNSTVSKIDVEKLINGVVQAVGDGRLDARIIDERAQKVLALRHHLATL